MESRAGADGYVYMEFKVPARGLIGLANRMLNATQGRAIMHHSFLDYEPMHGADSRPHQRRHGRQRHRHRDRLRPRRPLRPRVLLRPPRRPVYEGQIVGEHCKEKDITVNAVKAKQLTNMRAASKDDAAKVRPARAMALEQCLEYIQDDELVEMTPKSIRMRKRNLRDVDRRRAARQKAG